MGEGTEEGLVVRARIENHERMLSHPSRSLKRKVIAVIRLNIEYTCRRVLRRCDTEHYVHVEIYPEDLLEVELATEKLPRSDKLDVRYDSEKRMLIVSPRRGRGSEQVEVVFRVRIKDFKEYYGLSIIKILDNGRVIESSERLLEISSEILDVNVKVHSIDGDLFIYDIYNVEVLLRNKSRGNVPLKSLEVEISIGDTIREERIEELKESHAIVIRDIRQDDYEKKVLVRVKSKMHHLYLKRRFTIRASHNKPRISISDVIVYASRGTLYLGDKAKVVLRATNNSDRALKAQIQVGAYGSSREATVAIGPNRSLELPLEGVLVARRSGKAEILVRCIDCPGPGCRRYCEYKLVEAVPEPRPRYEFLKASLSKRAEYLLAMEDFDVVLALRNLVDEAYKMHVLVESDCMRGRREHEYLLKEMGDREFRVSGLSLIAKKPTGRCNVLVKVSDGYWEYKKDLAVEVRKPSLVLEVGREAEVLGGIESVIKLKVVNPHHLPLELHLNAESLDHGVLEVVKVAPLSTSIPPRGGVELGVYVRGSSKGRSTLRLIAIPEYQGFRGIEARRDVRVVVLPPIRIRGPERVEIEVPYPPARSVFGSVFMQKEFTIKISSFLDVGEGKLRARLIPKLEEPLRVALIPGEVTLI